jgi:glycosyltransferase involved in cell wall biosynthesis
MKVQGNYSVLMSIYHKELPEHLESSLNSMFTQTYATNNFVLICDGPLTIELDTVIAEYQIKFPDILKVYRIQENQGLGVSLRLGIEYCENEFIARMDSDDIAANNRCERQLEVITKGYDIVGSNIDEFIGTVDNVIASRIVPENHDDIAKFSKKRNPFNHPSVMYRKSKVLRAGSYRNEYRLEDYYLWIDMLSNGCKGYNIQENLVHMRSTYDMYKRRSGTKLIKSLLTLRKYMLKIRAINLIEFVSVVVVQTILAAVPNSIRSVFYRMYLRRR